MTSLRDAAPWFWDHRRWGGVLGAAPRPLNAAPQSTSAQRPTALPAAISQSLKLAARSSAGWHMLTDEEREALDTMAHDIAMILDGGKGRSAYWRNVATMCEAMVRCGMTGP